MDAKTEFAAPAPTALPDIAIGDLVVVARTGGRVSTHEVVDVTYNPRTYRWAVRYGKTGAFTRSGCRDTEMNIAKRVH